MCLWLYKTKLYSYKRSTRAMAASRAALAVTASLFAIHGQLVPATRATWSRL